MSVLNMLPTLKFFLSDNFKQSNSYIKHKHFSSLYLRKSRYYIKFGENGKGEFFNFVIQIANITARKLGKGYFTRLIDEIKNLCPDKIIVVENVFDERFANKLKNMNFQEFNKVESFYSSFVLWSENQQQLRNLAITELSNYAKEFKKCKS